MRYASDLTDEEWDLVKDFFAILPERWIVERTFAWLGNYRRLSKDYEKLLISEENMVRIAMLRITVKKCV